MKFKNRININLHISFSKFQEISEDQTNLYVTKSFVLNACPNYTLFGLFLYSLLNSNSLYEYSLIVRHHVSNCKLQQTLENTFSTDELLLKALNSEKSFLEFYAYRPFFHYPYTSLLFIIFFDKKKMKL